MRRKKAFTLTELLVITAIIAILAAILFPVFSQAVPAGKANNSTNLKKLALSAQRYGQDADERIPIVSNGRYRDLQNVHDGVLTSYGEQRTDLWPLLLLPYVKDRTIYVDPQRGDVHGIYAGPPLVPTDAGYDPLGNTYRNQNRFSMFGFNFVFLSPMFIPASKMIDATPTDFMVGEAHEFFAAFDPSGTVFYSPAYRGYVPQDGEDIIGVQDPTRGFSLINAPGMWDVLVVSTSPYVLFWNGTQCSGDWCGTDVDPNTAGTQTSENYFYKDPTSLGNNTVFLDSHVKFMTATQLAAGTDYPTAVPNNVYFSGGAQITDKSKYIWNLDANFFGA
jgi:type II secretory pathway pseudopilin PulG